VRQLLPIFLDEPGSADRTRMTRRRGPPAEAAPSDPVFLAVLKLMTQLNSGRLVEWQVDRFGTLTGAFVCELRPTEWCELTDRRTRRLIPSCWRAKALEQPGRTSEPVSQQAIQHE
jgi:hypothetical protein